MLANSVCPDGAALRELLLGQASDAEAGGLEAHLAQCPHCLETVRAMRVDDTLTAALRTWAHAAVVPADEELIARLCASAGQSTMAQAASPGAQIQDILAPAGGPDELGRLGPYRVLRLLGTGGMGLVFHAEDLQLGRPVALKVMKPALATSAAARQRFLREARSMAAVKSDHVVTIYQVGEDRGVPFLAMELLQGEPMDHRLTPGREPGTAELLRMAREMALGLAAAHERGLIHRDLKPGNVWLEAPTGRVKLLDFGLARAAEEDVQLTASGAIIGTPAYMAPEQACGDRLDHRADLFSLGVVLYRLCTGQLPFRAATTMAALTALAVENPKPVREVAPAVPRALADLTMRLLKKDPADRPRSAKDVVAALRAIERETAPPAEPGPVGRAPAGGRRVRIGVAVAVLIAVLGPLAWYFGPTVIRIATDKGELIVEVDDPAVEVVVKPEGVLLQSGKEQTLVVAAGNGTVEVRDPAKDWTLVTKEFSLKRGGKEAVRVKRQEVAQARDARAKDTKAPADAEKPFVIVPRGGERRGFKTFAEALAERKEGDAIEVHGDGPFPVPAAQVEGKGLVLKAAPGHRPVLVAQLEEGARRPWLAVLGGEVVVEGCDFHGDVIFPGWFLDSGPEPKPAAPWTFRNCRFWVNGAGGLINCAAGPLCLEDCLIVGTFAEASLSLGPRVDLQMTNNLVSQSLKNVILASGNQTLTLTDNYLTGAEALLRPPLDEAPARPVTVIAAGNIFDRLQMIGDSRAGMPSVNVARAQLRWQARNNLYVPNPGPFAAFARENRQLKTLNDWTGFWGRAEPGSIELGGVSLMSCGFGWGPSSALQTMRQRVEALCGRLGVAARHVGPEWDLLGPGDAHVRALERATGKLLRGGALRPEAPAGGPFVLLRDGDASRGYGTLRAALDASGAGDTIEVRGDGPFAGADFKARERRGRLTLRAAPGYQPVLETSLNLQVPKAEVEIEGLTFEHEHLTGDFGRLTMRNCAMHTLKAPWTLACVVHGPGQAARFLNCTFNLAVSCTVGPGQSALFENCVLTRASAVAKTDDDDYEFVIRRSLCWAIDTCSGSVACDQHESCQPRVRAEDSVFVGGAVLTWSGRQSRWSGHGNVYSLTSGFASFQPFYTLGAWQKRWDSDRDSLFTPSPFLEPRLWRLLPGHPKRPDGKDYGADVDRVARTPPP